MTIEDGDWLEVGGRRQWVSVRGRDVRNPALLFVGGAGAGYCAAAPFFAPWEDDFTVVLWDQPGSGFTGGEPMSYADLGWHCASVALGVCGCFGLPRPVLLATSGGTVTALQALAASPGRFAAYVGTGQVVGRARQETLSYRLVLERARARGDAAAIAALESVGEPPYVDAMGDFVKSQYANAPTPAEAAEWAQLVALGPPKPGAKHAPAGVAPADPMPAAMAAWMATRDELGAWDARSLGARFGVPMHVIQGEDDLHTVTSEVIPWAEEVGASLQLIPGAGHLSVFLRQEMLARLKRALI